MEIYTLSKNYENCFHWACRLHYLGGVVSICDGSVILAFYELLFAGANASVSSFVVQKTVSNFSEKTGTVFKVYLFLECE